MSTPSTPWTTRHLPRPAHRGDDAVLRPRFDARLREEKQALFSMEGTSSAGFSLPWVNPSDGREYEVYGNPNLSIYSAAECNAACPFCVEKLRPLSRGGRLEEQREVASDRHYFERMENAFRILRPLDPTLSITGGEPSIDPRLPRIVELVKHFKFRKRTFTTNGSGLLPNGLVPLLVEGGFSHLNLSRAHHDGNRNQEIMKVRDAFTNADLSRVVELTRGTGLRPRLSCVLQRGAVDDLESVLEYLEWASSIGVDNVVFRQIMSYDRGTYLPDPVVSFCEGHLVEVAPILQEIHGDLGERHPSFEFTKQVVGYYYYVEVYSYESKAGRRLDVVFEEADLSWIERRKREDGKRPRPRVYEFVFHPNGRLCSTWQPWDGALA
ncbi:MAG: radical SAM protein [Promethearchaeota archaeon]